MRATAPSGSGPRRGRRARRRRSIGDGVAASGDPIEAARSAAGGTRRQRARRPVGQFYGDDGRGIGHDGIALLRLGDLGGRRWSGKPTARRLDLPKATDGGGKSSSACAGVDAEERHRAHPEEPAAAASSIARSAPRRVEVVVERGPHLLERAVAGSRGPPALETHLGLGEEAVLPVPRAAVMLREHREPDRAGLMIFQQVAGEHEVAE